MRQATYEGRWNAVGKIREFPPVFICHSSLDREVVENICSALESNSISYWISSRDIIPGEKSLDLNFKAVEGAEILVLIISSNTYKSHYVELEINIALDKNIRIIPFIIEDISPQGIFRPVLVGFQGINAFTPPLEKHIDRLVRAINVHLIKDGRSAGNVA